MTFYDCKEKISEDIAAYLQGIQREQGLVPMELVARHREIRDAFPDLYSQSLLMKGAPKEEAPTFSNVAKLTDSWDVRDRFEEVFAALALPDTQSAVHAFWRRIQRGSLENILTGQQKENLQNLWFFKERTEKLSSWITRASNILNIMTSNLPSLKTVTEEEKEFADLLQTFDWYYSYSDQASTWRAGEVRHKEVGAKVKQVLAEKPHLKKVVEAVAAAHNLGPGFFTYTG